MNAIVKTDCTKELEKYQIILLQKENYKKEALQWRLKYLHEFGDLVTEMFTTKVRCIAKKKSIELCVLMQNKGEELSHEKLQEHITESMKTYYQTLKQLVEENTASKSLVCLSDDEVKEIKKIYRQLVKKLHPDINPLTAENEILTDLWHKICIAYQQNDLCELKELKVIAAAVLDKSDTVAIEIPNIAEKTNKVLKEINKILTTEPYIYCKYFQSDEAYANKKDELKKELEEYKSYEAQLDCELKKYPIEGVDIQWEII